MRAKQLGRDALHHPMHLAMDIGMQPAEIRDARRRPHAAEESIALDQQRAAPRARRSHRGRDAGRPAAEHGDFILAVERHLARGFCDGFGGQIGVPGWWRSWPGPGILAMAPHSAWMRSFLEHGAPSQTR